MSDYGGPPRAAQNAPSQLQARGSFFAAKGHAAMLLLRRGSLCARSATPTPTRITLAAEELVDIAELVEAADVASLEQG
jgi:hypothetical protein